MDRGLIQRKYATDHGGRVTGAPAPERLAAIDAAAGTGCAEEIRAAIDGRDRAALFAAEVEAFAASAARRTIAPRLTQQRMTT